MIVVISGSRSIKSLNIEARDRIQKIVALGADILVGDCYGVDSAVQQYLKSINYTRVTVYHIGNKPRYNAGFPTCQIAGSRYSDKDRAMCNAADYGLAIYDGRSKGTLANINALPTRVVLVA